jgi:hypothetical protein
MLEAGGSCSMDKRGNVIFALVLIGFGVLFLVFNFIPGLTFRTYWPFIFFILAAGFFLPPLIVPSARKGLASLFIPGMILLVLGMILFYDTMTHDWASWGYAWLLIPGSVGLGLMSAAWVGGWGQDTINVGFWMMMISLMFFAFVSSLFGAMFLKIGGPAVLIILGLFFVIRSIRR